MKTVLLAIKKLHGYFVENKLISMVYILSYLISVLVFTYMYNNFVPRVTREASDDSFDHYYAFYFAEEVKEFSDLREYLEAYNTHYVMYYHRVVENEAHEDDSEGTEGNKVIFEIIEDDSEPITVLGTQVKTPIPCIVAYKNNDIKTTLVEGRTSFTQEELTDGSRVAIFPANSSLGRLSESYEYNNISYNAIGWHVGPELIIPEEAFVAQGLGMYKFEVYFDELLTVEENREFIKDITQMYSVERVVSPADLDDIYEGNSRQILLMMIVGFAVMIFVFGYLIRYMTLSNQNESVIYRLVGAGNGNLIAITAFETLLLNLLLSITAIIIHVVTFDTLFDKWNFYSSVVLELKDYVLIVGVTTVFSFIATLPHIIRSINSTLVANKKRI